MIPIFDHTRSEDNFRHRHREGYPSVLAFHRIQVPGAIEGEVTGPMVAEMFRDRRPGKAGSYTGGKMPYAFVIRRNGAVDQCLRVSLIAPHARTKWSAVSLSVALVGDHRHSEPSAAQLGRSVPFAALWLAAGLDSRGHDELPGGSSDPDKECPGKLLSMAMVREEAARHPCARLDADAARAILVEFGVVF